MDNLFTTHPSTENRIAALQQLARELGRSDSMSHADIEPPHSPWNRPPASRGPWG
jgi:heat shock protein HtpX